MTEPQIESKTKTIELAANAFEAFCDDISGMFGIEMKCVKTGLSTETTKGLSQKFKKLAAITFIKSEGIINGTFHTVFDQAGMFALAGIIIMLPKQKIIDDIKRGTLKDAEAIADTIKENGNLLVGSWDRVFREEMEGHGHFLQSNTYIGNPWDNPKEKIGIPDSEQFEFVSFQITVEDYPPFNCGVFFPEAIFIKPEIPEQAPVAVEEAVAKTENAVEVKPENKDATPIENAVAEKSQGTDAPKVENAAQEKPPAAEAQNVNIVEETSVPASVPADVKINEDNKTPAVEVAVAKSAEGKEPAAGPVSQIIQKMVESSPQFKDGLVSLKMCAKDIMQTAVIFGNAEDSVQQALTKMQQAQSSYMIIGKDNLLEGIVSTYDLASAISVYLKPVFAKWRRPTDDATLQIRLKWIMTRPVRTVKPETSIASVMEIMCQTGLRCMPVTAANGKVEGLITVFDVFKALLKTDSAVSSVGKPLQAAALA